MISSTWSIFRTSYRGKDLNRAVRFLRDVLHAHPIIIQRSKDTVQGRFNVRFACLVAFPLVAFGKKNEFLGEHIGSFADVADQRLDDFQLPR